ncbi:MAG: hypothetical protein EA376_10545 [Phycisphaeraceae bacterium]|nr:MAG: hypothetical protein EA376_10545 [Phycisphaeraceae bacterium]
MNELTELKQHLTRIEEAQTFSDRSVEDLSKQVADIYHKLEQMSGRIRILETAIHDARTSPTGPGPDQPGP